MFAFAQAFTRLAELLRPYIKTHADQLAAVGHLEDAVTAFPHALPAFQTLLHTLYDVDPEVIGEAAVLAWHARPAAELSELQRKLRVQVKPFITWLQTAAEDSDEDGDDDDEDDQ